MRQGTCCQCGLTTTIRSFYSFNGNTYCEPCVWKASREAKNSGLPSEYISLTDNTICARCGADNGTTDFMLVGENPFCPVCAGLITNWPYPGWLKAALLCVLVLLGIALMNGRKYFHAGRAMYVGERLVEEHRYQEALPYLRETLKVAPGSDKAVLLTAKAALLTGDVEVAQQALQGHNAGRFEDGKSDEFQEVNDLWKRATAALDKADQAVKEAEVEGHGVQAARLMHEASSMYPESTGLKLAAERLDEGAAFDAKNYDLFLSMAQKRWDAQHESQSAAFLSSALACKYVVTGDAAYRRQAEEMLSTAQRLAEKDPKEVEAFAEYSERIRYRLDKKEIITREEYARRFRTDKITKK